MAWNYRLEEQGKQLREFVDGDLTLENCAKTIDQLRVCCKNIMDQMGNEDKDYSYNDFEELYELMDGEADILRNNPSELFEIGFTGGQELVNERLTEFYDLCDSARVWIGL